jgi:phosphatidylserine decarboxylase
VNRIPASGVIEFERYVPGDYLVAWHPKASAKNERSELGVQHPDGHKIFFKQIAGAVARRIVYHVRAGDTVQAGERFGIVKFGSRMDVHVPAGVALDVEVGERVRAGESIIGRFPVSESVDASSSPSSRESISP